MLFTLQDEYKCIHTVRSFSHDDGVDCQIPDYVFKVP